MTQLLYHATLNAHLPSIIKEGLLPRRGAFARAAHGQPCPQHPEPARIHVTKSHLDGALFSALCFHVVRHIQSIVGFNDAFLTEHFEPGWLSAKDLAAFGALIEIEASDDGHTWGRPVLRGRGVDAVTEIVFRKPVTIRFLRVTLTHTSKWNSWSIDELRVLKPAVK